MLQPKPEDRSRSAAGERAATLDLGAPQALAGMIDQLSRAVHGLGFFGGLNPAQWAALRHLGRADEPRRTVGGLAEDQGVTPPTASETVSALVRKGYVERLPSTGDKRSHRLALTSIGRSLLEVDPLRQVGVALAALPEVRRRLLAEEVAELVAALAAQRARRREAS